MTSPGSIVDVGVGVGVGVAVGVDPGVGVSVGVGVGVVVGSAQAASIKQPSKTVASAITKNCFKNSLLFLFGQCFLFIALP